MVNLFMVLEQVRLNGKQVFYLAPEDLEEMDGMVMDMVSFIPQDLAESFKVFVYDPVTGFPVDSTELIDGASLVLGEWHDVIYPTLVQIDCFSFLNVWIQSCRFRRHSHLVLIVVLLIKAMAT